MNVRTVFLSLLLSGTALAAQSATAVFAGGCFWGVEAVFEQLKGVGEVVSGYTGGTVTNPSYEEVSNGSTGHAEAVRVTFDPSVVSYETLLKVFLTVACDPTQLNYQGPDHGTQYRNGIWYQNPVQKAAAEAALKKLAADKIYRDPIVTTVLPAAAFWLAEDYHQDFIKNNPTQGYIVRFDLPKLRFLKKTYPGLVKS